MRPTRRLRVCHGNALLACVVPAVVLLATAFPRDAAAIDEAAGQERLGLRAGYVEALEGLDASYGDGWDLTLFFTEELFSRLVLDIRLGAVYLGDARDPELDDRIMNTPGIVSQMRLIYFSVGPMVGFSAGSSWSAYASAGVGVYSVSMAFSPAISAFNYSDQHVGFNGGAGLSRRIATNWCVEFNATFHYFGVDQTPVDLYYVFTDGADSARLLGAALGLTVDLR